MKNNLFDRLKPKESKFFPLLRDMAEVIVTASDLIIDCVQVTNHDDAVTIYKKIKEQEHKGDRIQNEIFEELNDTFITPFDREDINSISSIMDNVTDLINSCAKRIMLYSPKTMPESAKLLASLVRESGQNILEGVEGLASLKKKSDEIRNCCNKLKEIESKADDIYEHFIIDLFENEKDAVEVIKLKDILHELERATDAAEMVGKIMRTIIIKYT